MAAKNKKTKPSPRQTEPSPQQPQQPAAEKKLNEFIAQYKAKAKNIEPHMFIMLTQLERAERDFVDQSKEVARFRDLLGKATTDAVRADSRKTELVALMLSIIRSDLE